MVGALGVWAAVERVNLQYVVIECTREIGDKIKAKCTNQKEMKQGASMVMGGSLSLDCLQVSLIPAPSIPIYWKCQQNTAELLFDETAARVALLTHFESAEGVWLHRYDSFNALIDDGEPKNHSSGLTNDELRPIPSGAEWIHIQAPPEGGIEIHNEELAEAVAESVKGNYTIPQALLRALNAPALSPIHFLTRDDFYYGLKAVQKQFPQSNLVTTSIISRGQLVWAGLLLPPS